jgi:hypothetical protein
MDRLRTAYGASPLHALAVVASFAVAGYGFLRIAQSPSALGTFVWFAAAIFAHDLLAFPLYSTLNLIAHRSLVEPSDEWLESRRVPAINHLRVPAILSGVAFLMFFPLILGLDSARYAADTGLDVDVFLGRWLGICAALFLGSALIYAIRLRRAGRQPDEPEPSRS